jgi:hypothetical protein
MSPVSRGRKPKKSKKKAGSRRSAASGSSTSLAVAPTSKSGLGWLQELAAQRDEPEWWAASHDRVLDASVGLLAATGPRTLEQAVAELIGGELHASILREESGLGLDTWGMRLVDRAAARASAPAESGDARTGPVWLLHGLASFGSTGLATDARQRALAASRSLPGDLWRSLPGWLSQQPAATGDVRVIRDVYGTRTGVLAGFRYPADASPWVYLIDLDASGSVRLVGGGVTDDMDQAASAWRAAVGDSAADAVPEAATGESLTCLVYYEHEEESLFGDESLAVMNEWYRAGLRGQEVMAAVKAHGISLPEHRNLFAGIDYMSTAKAFTDWYSSRHGHVPPKRPVQYLAQEWLEGMLPGTEHMISPVRSRFYRELIGDWQEGQDRDAALDLLPEWVRWNGEESGVPAPFLERAVSAATGNAADAEHEGTDEVTAPEA